jgi:DNA-binding NarL/FixJ family response regulator
MQQKIRILIVDDHTILRAGIRALLELYPDMQVVGEAGDGETALLRCRELQPDVVLMDIAMPGINGLAATRQLVESCLHSRVLILTQHENKEYILPALKVGAAGYILKRAADTELVTGVVVEGLRQRRAAASEDPYETLSDREREVLLLLAQGRILREIGETLHLSPKTVDFHRANVMEKLGLKSRTELVQYAMRRGLGDVATT